MNDAWQHRRATIRGVECHYVEAGAGEVVLLLHGFPEFWYSWRHQLGPLAAAGFRAIAPDLRGYNESGKPAGVAAYRLAELEADVAGLLDHLGVESAHLVGHDWGGVVAWRFAQRRPERVRRLVVLNAPHPALYLRALRQPEQLLRSWYVFFFQVPWLAERFVRAGNYRLLVRSLHLDPLRRGAFTPADVQRYRTAFARPGALTAMLNYYRAGLRYPERRGAARPVQAPTLVIWGEQDRYLGIELTRGLDRLVPNLRLERIRDASHWVQHDVPDRVNHLLQSFLSER